MIEQEVKLPFEHLEAARAAVTAAGGRLVVSRRLLEDRLFDSPQVRLGERGMTLRVRRDDARTFLTFKGPIQPGPIKSREELETLVGDAAVFESVLTALGFRQVFRSQKYREEYDLGASHVAIDDAPLGVFIEIEATSDEIGRVSGLLGRSPADYRLESYPALWKRWCIDHSRPQGDMVFEGDEREPARGASSTPGRPPTR